MTLALVLRCSDGLVLATDSRTTGGSFAAADISEKFLQINRDIGIMTYGLAVPGYGTMRLLVEEVRNSPGTYATMNQVVGRVTAMATDVFNGFKTAQPNLANEIVGFILAGYDGNETGLFRIFHFSSQDGFAPQEQVEIIAAQWHLPMALSPYLQFAGMSVHQGRNLATLLMILTASYNSAVGGPIRLGTVTIGRGFSLLSEHEVHELVEHNQPRLAKLKMAWANGWLAVQ
jgi:hypothetical protein